jgi:hypothetical protein
MSNVRCDGVSDLHRGDEDAKDEERLAAGIAGYLRAQKFDTIIPSFQSESVMPLEEHTVKKQLSGRKAV